MAVASGYNFSYFPDYYENANLSSFKLGEPDAPNLSLLKSSTGAQNKSDAYEKERLTLGSLVNVMTVGETTVTLVPDSKLKKWAEGFGKEIFDELNLSHNQVCSPYYYCLYKSALYRLDGTSQGPHDDDPNNESSDQTYQALTEAFDNCLVNRFNTTKFNPEEYPTSFRCLIFLSSTDIWDYSRQFVPCRDLVWSLTQVNWVEQDVDKNFQISIYGGVDSLGVYWEGARINETMTDTVGRQLWNDPGARCTIKKPCGPTLHCTEIGSFDAIALGKTTTPMKIPWVFLVTSALSNMMQQFVTLDNELQHAIESLALDTFSIDEFSPKQDQHFILRKSLAGLGSILSILGGLVPVAGPAIATAGTIVSSAGTLLGNYIAASTKEVQPQDIFARQMLAFYTGFQSGLEDTVTRLFKGLSIPGGNGSKASISLI